MSLYRATPTARLMARSFARSSLASSSSSTPLRMVARGAATKPNSKPATTSLTPDDSLRILNEQRSVRPSSPHFTIYQPQLTWLGSIANRITGTGLSVGMYAYAIAYFGALHTGYGELVSSGYLTSLVASFPFWLKLSLKAPIAAAFNFHTWNGIRHLAWDMGYFISVKGCYQSGYAVLGVTALGTVGLCML